MDHALTIRLSDPVYQAAKQLATRAGISLSRLVQDVVAEKTAAPLESHLAHVYDLLATDTAETDVERFYSLQAEALLNA